MGCVLIISRFLFIFILTLGCIYFFVLMILFLGLFKIKKNRQFKKDYNPIFVSVVFATRNEEENISRCLQSLFCQTYRKDLYEVIMVDDNSNDNTFSIAETMSNEYDNLKLMKASYSDKVTGKQKALDTGIRYSKGEIIITLDADCQAPSCWIENIVKEFDPKVGLIAGYSTFDENLCYENLLGKIFFKLQLLELLSQYIFSMGNISQGLAWTCTGNNLSYRRKLYNELGGLEALGMTGLEDNMLIQWVGKYTNWQIMALPSNIVYTQYVKTVPEFFAQRIRWASSSTKYKLSLVLFLIVSYLFYLFTFFAIALVISGFLSLHGLLIILSLKIIPEFLLVSKGLILFNKLNLLIYFPLIQPIQLIYILICGIYGLSGTFVWKGREIRK